MKLSEYIKAGAGRQSELCRQIGAHAPDMSRWLKPAGEDGGRPVPSERCPAIELATEGQVTCEELRTDIKWSRIADAAWPHPDGRPVIDVARPAEQAEEPATEATGASNA